MYFDQMLPKKLVPKLTLLVSLFVLPIEQYRPCAALRGKKLGKFIAHKSVKLKLKKTVFETKLNVICFHKYRNLAHTSTECALNLIYL